MKLRNKKTGEVIETCKIIQNAFGEIIMLTLDEDERYPYEFHSLAELNEDWEDYKPQEPLIKDEKIRKAVRAWAEANSITQVSYDAGWNAFRCTDFVIAFDHDFDRHDGLEDMKSYTIAELCGEEEE